jgi:hypothetical protein
MSKATATMLSLEELHALTATQLAQVITEGVPIVDRETGEVVDRAPAPASYFAAAIKFLKDNNITAELAPDSPMAGLVGALPTFDDNDEHNQLMN